MVNLGNDWNEVLKEDFLSDSYLSLRKFLIDEYKNYNVYPNMHDIFNALKLTSFNKVKVVILGQDPYHNPNEAHGLSFSVKDGVRLPPSLKNIFKEQNVDLGIQISNIGCLEPWATQGVLLLNTILTVRENAPLSHKGRGWEVLTDSIIKHLNSRENPIIFLLWGANARAKKALITNKNHYILEAPHPSPLSAHCGFFGCKHFSKTNEILKNLGETQINWDLSRG